MSHQRPEMSHISSCSSSTFFHIGYAARHAKRLSNETNDRKPFFQGLRSSNRSAHARETRRCGYAVSISA